MKKMNDLEFLYKKYQNKIINCLDTILYYKWDRTYYGKNENVINKNIENLIIVLDTKIIKINHIQFNT